MVREEKRAKTFCKMTGLVLTFCKVTGLVLEQERAAAQLEAQRLADLNSNIESWCWDEFGAAKAENMDSE